MPESESHKRAKANAAGKSGRTEVTRGTKRLDATSAGKATEVERSGTSQGLEKAAARLKASKKPQKVLQVPQQDMSKAVEAMKKKGLSGIVKNMGGTKTTSVRAKKKG